MDQREQPDGPRIMRRSRLILWMLLGLVVASVAYALVTISDQATITTAPPADMGRPR